MTQGTNGAPAAGTTEAQMEGPVGPIPTTSLAPAPGELLELGVTPCGATYRSFDLHLRVCGRPELHVGIHFPTPFQIDAGTPQSCSTCGKVDSDEAFTLCDECGALAHPDCLATCDRCGALFHEDARSMFPERTEDHLCMVARVV